MTALERHLQQLTQRRTDRTPESYETIVTCTRCRTVVALFEACSGASSEAEHRWGNHDTFTCAGCLEQAAK